MQAPQSLDWRRAAGKRLFGPVVSAGNLTTAHRGDGIASLQMSALQAANISNQTKVFPNGLPIRRPPAASSGLGPRDAAQNPTTR